MSNWGFVALAYAVVWGGIAVYALLLARRVTQARAVAKALRAAADEDDSTCDDDPSER